MLDFVKEFFAAVCLACTPIALLLGNVPLSCFCLLCYLCHSIDKSLQQTKEIKQDITRLSSLVEIKAPPTVQDAQS